MRGGELFDAVCRRELVHECDAARVMRQLLSAVDHIHGLGVIHRDLKLTNVYRTTDESWVLGDFGSALLDAETVTFSTREELGARYGVEVRWTSELGARCAAAPASAMHPMQPAAKSAREVVKVTSR